MHASCRHREIHAVERYGRAEAFAHADHFEARGHHRSMAVSAMALQFMAETALPLYLRYFSNGGCIRSRISGWSMFSLVTSLAPVSTRFSMRLPARWSIKSFTPRYPMRIGSWRINPLISPDLRASTSLADASNPMNFTLPAFFPS